MKRKFCEICGAEMPSNATECGNCKMEITRAQAELVLKLLKDIGKHRLQSDDEVILEHEVEEHLERTEK